MSFIPLWCREGNERVKSEVTHRTRDLKTELIVCECSNLSSLQGFYLWDFFAWDYRWKALTLDKAISCCKIETCGLRVLILGCTGYITSEDKRIRLHMEILLDEKYITLKINY